MTSTKESNLRVATATSRVGGGISGGSRKCGLSRCVLCGVLTGVAAVGLLLSAGVTFGGLVAGVSVALICLMA